jgi:DNA-directed RNA polymerase subunit RPC12/RpoP
MNLERRIKMKEFLGYCKECGAEVFNTDSIPNYEDILECSNCKHPSLINELWDIIPDYITNVISDKKIAEGAKSLADDFCSQFDDSFY